MDPHQLRANQYQQFNKMNKKNWNYHGNKISVPAPAVNRSYYRDRQPNSHGHGQIFARRQSADRSVSSPSSFTTFSMSVPESAAVSPINSTPSSPHQKNSAVSYENAPTINLASTTFSTMDSSDLKQNCLLFPTYAIRRSDSKDWDVRIRGWAYSQRANRRRRLAMTVARKIAGITKDHEIYETLESRFGMFLNNNTQGANFTIQCTGATSSTHMELAGDAESGDPIEEILPELDSSTRDLDEAEVEQEKAQLRESIEQNREEILKTLSTSPAISRFKSVVTAALSSERSKSDEYQFQSVTIQSKTEEEFKVDEDSKYPPGSEILLSNLTTPDSESSWKISKGASFFKSAFTKSKPAGNNSSTYSNEFNDLPPSLSRRFSASGSSSTLTLTMSSSSISTGSNLKNPLGASHGKTQYADCGDGSFPTINALSQPGGHFSGTIDMTEDQIQKFKNEHIKNGGVVSGDHPKFLKLRAYHNDMPEPAHGLVNLIGPEGVSIISDIDDTIKETNVTAGARTVLRNTFLKKMQEVEGMAKAYKKWEDQDAAFHYVSNSPWQLIPTLLEFFHTHRFPPGSAHLKTHENNVLKTYFMTPGENKLRSICEIMHDFPNRKFILIGDSGEIDLEIYTKIAIKFPGQVFRIFIRDVNASRFKEPIKTSPVRGRTFPFGRRGSSTALPENSSTPNLSTVSASAQKDEKDSESGFDIPIALTPEELTAEETATQAVTALSNEILLSAELAKQQQQQSPRSPSGIKMAGSFLSNAFRRSSITNLGNAIKKRGNKSPMMSPRVSDIMNEEYPFPLVDTSSSISLKMRTTSNLSMDYEDDEDDVQIRNNIATKSLSSISISSSHSESTPMQSPKISPSSLGRGIKGNELESMSTLNPGISHIEITTKQSIAISTTSSSISSLSQTSPVSESSLPFSPNLSSSTSFAVVNTAADSWNERLIECRKKLPDGITLTVFESAEELEQCMIVQEMFERCNNKSSLEESEVNVIPTSPSTLSVATIVSPNGNSSLSNVKCVEERSKNQVGQVGLPIAV